MFEKSSEFTINGKWYRKSDINEKLLAAQKCLKRIITMKSDKTMDKSSSKAEFDSVEFEKRLTNLKDTQDSIQALSSWCLQNRSHHKKIVTSWLVVLKQGKIPFSAQISLAVRRIDQQYK